MVGMRRNETQSFRTSSLQFAAVEQVPPPAITVLHADFCPADIVEALDALATEIDAASQDSQSGNELSMLASTLRETAWRVALAPSEIRDRAIAPLLERAHAVLAQCQDRRTIRPAARSGVRVVVDQDDEDDAETVVVPFSLKTRRTGLRLAAG